MKRLLSFLLLLGGLAGCGNTTGGARVSFSAAAAGPSDATGGALSFVNQLGYSVTLSKARLHVGAVYLNQTVPISGAQETACILPGTYVAQVLSSVDVNLLSASMQPFPERGRGLGTEAKVGEVWLTGGDINATDDRTVILDAAGIASRSGQDFPFSARLTIGQNRTIPQKEPAYPGANPLCKQRIVTPIPAEITPAEGGTLVLRIDPRVLFHGVEFAEVPKVSDTPPLYRFSDRNDNPADTSLFQNGLRSRANVYAFSFLD